MSHAATRVCLSAVRLWACLLFPCSLAHAQEALKPPTKFTNDRIPHAFEAWNSCSDKKLTLEGLAARARPAFWFASQEPLVALNVPTTIAAGPNLEPTGRRAVYYRITKLRSEEEDDALFAAMRLPRSASEGSPRDKIESVDQEYVATLPFPEAASNMLAQVSIRYLFYYPIDVGATGHADDLEALDLDFELETVRQNGKFCRIAWLRRVHASAHGMGLYTNTLDLEPVERSTAKLIAGVAPEVRTALLHNRLALPLAVYVEAGKHAMAPSRDGDAHFDFGLDVNSALSDAWGIRDNFRNNRVAPRFNEAMVGDRRLGDNDRKTCAATEWSPSYEKRDPALVEPERLNRVCPDQYDLHRTTQEAAICGTEPKAAERKAALEAFIAAVVPERQGFLHELLDGKDFCGAVNLDKRTNLARRIKKLRIGPARAENPYSRLLEHIPLTFRRDRGPSLSVIVPTGFQVPMIGGWLVPRMSISLGRRNRHTVEGNSPSGTFFEAFDLSYTSSASAFISPYGRVGIDRYVCQGDEALSKGCRREVYLTSVVPDKRFRSSQMALEFGVAIRLKHPSWNTGLLGGRVGIRWYRWRNPLFPRLIFELGWSTW